ncbi:MAG: hypothetical protein JSS72_09445 [Armatimonadetes bacterium]|nr:hypothetical protein [Armatimonadota bacterium]
MSSVNQIANPMAAAAASTTAGKDQLNMKDFLVLLTTELSNQLPTDPITSKDYYAQIAQIGTVQGVDQLSQTSQEAQAASLLGKTVTASTQQGVMSGVVKKVTISGGNVNVVFNDANGNSQTVQLSNVQSVSN